MGRSPSQTDEYDERVMGSIVDDLLLAMADDPAAI
jgi:hypothetical protein